MGMLKLGQGNCYQMSHSQPGTVGQNQPTGVDVQALAKLNLALEKRYRNY
nr:protein ALWAYS EARLY 3-like [Ipomoea batatas]